MGVVADDHVGTGIDDHPREFLLGIERLRLVFGAPVREDDDEVRAGGAGGLDVLTNVAGDERRAADPRRRGVIAGRDRVVGQDRDPDSIDREQAGSA